MDLVSRVQILDMTVCLSFYANALGKDMNPSFILLGIDKIVGQTGLFDLSRVTSLGEGKTLNSRARYLPNKIWKDLHNWAQGPKFCGV